MIKDKQPLDLATQKQLAKNWQLAGDVLENVRRQELESMTQAEHLLAFYRVLSFPQKRKPKLNSDLADYQRKLHRQQG
jgi:hypothetical protein